MAKTIVAIEDDAMSMKLFGEILESLGHTLVPAADGMTGLDLVRRHRPDLILMDVQLPDISGLEVTRRIKGDSALKHIPIIAVTAIAMAGDEERVLASGCDVYIAKPIQMRDILSAIQKMLGESI